MADPTPLSPAAQAVRDAALATYGKSIPKDDKLWALDRPSVVAALRAAAEQVVPEFWHEEGDIYGETMQGVRQNILAIATELEGAQ